MKKKYLALGLCLVLSLSACGGQKATQEPAQEPDQKVVQQTEPAPQLVQVKAEAPVEPENTTGENAVDEAAPVEEAEPVGEVETVGEVELFTSCEETVYATGEVNIRASYSSSSDKLGSLARGDSVTRTGNSIAGTEAENWSRVQLSDGSTAYINNNYLSLTKPAQQQQATGGTGGSSASSKTTQQQATTDTTSSGTPADAGISREGWVQLPNGTWFAGELPASSSEPSGSTAPKSAIMDSIEEGKRALEKQSEILGSGGQGLLIDEEGHYYYEF